jgi:hypothetical protein
VPLVVVSDSCLSSQYIAARFSFDVSCYRSRLNKTRAPLSSFVIGYLQLDSVVRSCVPSRIFGAIVQCSFSFEAKQHSLPSCY